MVEPVSMTSAFLNSPVVGGVASAAASKLLGQGDSFGKYKRNLRASIDIQNNRRRIYDKYYVHPREDSAIQRRVADARAAGLHPLAALGIPMATGGSSGGPTPILPGQSSTGSAIGEGIRTAQSIASTNASRQHAQQLADLSLEEQRLRNVWLEEQIKNQRAKRLQGMANAAGRGNPHLLASELEQRKREAGLPSTYTVGHGGWETGRTPSAEDLETRYGEVAQQLGGVINMGFDLAGNNIDQGTVSRIIDDIHPPLTNRYSAYRNRMDRLYPDGKRYIRKYRRDDYRRRSYSRARSHPRYRKY